MLISARGLYQGALFSIIYVTDSFRQNPHNHEFFVYIVIKRFFFSFPFYFVSHIFNVINSKKTNIYLTFTFNCCSTGCGVVGFSWPFIAFTVHCKNFVSAPKLF